LLPFVISKEGLICNNVGNPKPSLLSPVSAFAIAHHIVIARLAYWFAVCRAVVVAFVVARNVTTKQSGFFEVVSLLVVIRHLFYTGCFVAKAPPCNDG
jgi:hypothetical protein